MNSKAKIREQPLITAGRLDLALGMVPRGDPFGTSHKLASHQHGILPRGMAPTIVARRFK